MSPGGTTLPRRHTTEDFGFQGRVEQTNDKVSTHTSTGPVGAPQPVMPSSSMAPHLGVCVVVVRLTLAAAFAAKPSSLPGCWDGQHLIRRREAAPFKGFGSPVHVRGLRGGFSFEQAGGVLGMSASSIRVASYNVLSSCLCEPSYYCNSDPEALEPTKRLERVIGKLETECEKGAVVCLQEVSRQWSGDLHVFFAKRGYSMINVGYGGKNNGYMGVSLAYKLANYELMETGIEKVSDFKAWPKAPPPGRFKALRMYFAEVIRKLRRQRKPENEWADAERRHNCLVWARLKDRCSPLIPCEEGSVVFIRQLTRTGGFA